MARAVLVIGLGPALMQAAEAAGNSFPAVDDEVVRKGLAATRQQLDAIDFEMDACRLDADETVEDVLRERLASRSYDCVVIGGGIRMVPGMTPLFERIVNVLHRTAPGLTFAFNTSPASTADAVARWFPAT